MLASGRVASQNIYETYNIYRNPVKVILNKFSITLTTGYSNTNYKQTLENVFFYQNGSTQLVFSNSNPVGPTSVTGFSDWLNNPVLAEDDVSLNLFNVPFDRLVNPVNNPALTNRPILLDVDSASVSFERAMSGIPVTLNIHYNIKDFRIGGGFSWEKQFFRELNPVSSESRINPYTPNFNSTSYTRWFGTAGYKFYEFWSYDFVGEIQYGKINAGKQFNRSVINRGNFFNIGVSIENNWSEYFRLVFRPGYDVKKYTVSLPDESSVVTKYNAFTFQAGVSINIPDIRRSPMRSDHTQLKHVYTDPVTGRLEEVRGQPIWKRQNPKVGENHRRLWKNKRKNRKKLSPY